ncbi:SPOR domain-containing protein [Novosphingobium sp. JCM 18896]|uniref:SPOR domain-containing protein n=1 Tax=Novosphingobium sp. JCM 18896 TaxID=2989731 RepID=UPI00222348D2|nr:SPOR domain-containing protein [Novosphingobium sp. JCM 18896]MCW1430532.1 SPOR domain-containing protein [Novosphingobium sp. JCM 18896]
MATRIIRLAALTSALALAVAGAQVGAQGVPQRSTTPGGVLPRATGLPQVSQPVVQAIPSSDGMTLNDALGRLARDPRDVGALIDAGNAALVMGDVDAATGFFRRADQVAPGNPRVKAGLAGAMVRNGDPFGAIPLFDQAEAAGALDSSLAADRGLAYDLVGDNATAQRYYRQSLARMPSEEGTRRMALSQAIAGDKQGAETTLAPLLQARNLAAWRTRAFALAIVGQTEEAVSVANSVLPAELASGIAPYLRYMPRLTRAQQAAAANFGAFPRASEIGRDDPRVAQYAPKAPAIAAVDAALTPKGQPLGRKVRSRDRNRNSRSTQVAAAPPDLQPTREVAAAAAAVPAPTRVAAAAPTRAARTPSSAPAPAPARPTPTPTPVPQAVRTPTPAPAPMSTPPRTAAVAGVLPVAPGFNLVPSTPPSVPPAASSPTPLPAAAAPTPAPAAVIAQIPTTVPAPVPAPTPAPAAPPPVRSLSDAFADFARPSIDVTPTAGAVDLRRIKPARPEPKKPPEPPKPSHPSRIWVQVATGRDKAALGFDWRRMIRENAEVFRGKAAMISAWGQTNRLLTGPFQSEAAANAFIGQLRRADVEGAFVWTSPAGQVVDALPMATTTPPRR